MAQVTVQRYAAELGRLPPTCICCGRPAQQMVRHKFYYDPLWLILFGPLMGWLRYIWASQSVVLFAPVCSRHGWRLGLPTYVAYGFAASLLVIAPLLIASSQIESLRAAMGWIWLAVFLYTTGMLALMLVVRLATPRMVDFDNGTITFGSVALPFKAAITGQAPPGQGLRSLGPTNPAMSNPGMPGQPAYGTHLTSPATNNGPLFALLGIGGGLAVLFVLFTVVGVSVYMNRARRNAEVRRMQAEGQAFHDKARADAEAMHKQHMAQIAANSRRTSVPTFTAPPPAPITIPASTSTSSLPPPFTSPTPAPPPPPPPTVAATPPSNPTTPSDTAASNAASSTPDDPFGIGQQIGPPSTISAGGIPPKPRDLAAKDDRPIAGRFDKPPADVGPDGQVEVSFRTDFRGGFPPNSRSLTRITDLKSDMEVWIKDTFAWYRGKVQAIDGLQVMVHIHGRDPADDELVPIQRLRVATDAQQPAANDGKNPFEEALPSRKRTWTDTTGKFTIAAEFIKLAGGKVTLKREDGSEISLPLEMLAPADQQIARQLGGM